MEATTTDEIEFGEMDKHKAAYRGIRTRTLSEHTALLIWKKSDELSDYEIAYHIIGDYIDDPGASIDGSWSVHNPETVRDTVPKPAYRAPEHGYDAIVSLHSLPRDGNREKKYEAVCDGLDHYFNLEATVIGDISGFDGKRIGVRFKD